MTHTFTRGELVEVKDDHHVHWQKYTFVIKHKGQFYCEPISGLGLIGWRQCRPIPAPKKTVLMAPAVFTDSNGPWASVQLFESKQEANKFAENSGRFKLIFWPATITLPDGSTVPQFYSVEVENG